MKLKAITTILLIMSFNFSLLSQTFFTKYSQEYFQRALSLIEYKPNNYMICGGINNGEYGGQLIKINPNGTITKKDTTKNAFLNKIFKISSNEYLLTGYIINTPHEIYFTKIDTNFNIIWENKYKFNQIEGHYYEFANPIIDKDSILVIPGYHFLGPYPNFGAELQVFKFSLQGDSLDFKNYDTIAPGTTLTFSNNIIQNSLSGNYYVNIENDVYNSLCYKLNNDLSVDSIYTYYEQESFGLNRKTTSKFLSDSTFITSCTNEGYMMATKHRIQIQDTNFNVLNKIDLEYPGLDLNTQNVFHSIDFKNKDYIYTVSNGTVITCLDSNLNINWQKFYKTYSESTIEHEIKGVFATSDKGAIILIDDFTPGKANLLILKVDSLGNSPLSTEDVENYFKISNYAIFPNPASDILKIQKAVQVPEAEIVLYNSVGQTILRKKLTENITEIDVSDLLNGVYIYNIFRDGKKDDEGKIIVE